MDGFDSCVAQRMPSTKTRVSPEELLEELVARARALNINPTGMRPGELIRALQRVEGNFDCFGSATTHCDQRACRFRSLCLGESVGQS